MARGSLLLIHQILLEVCKVLCHWDTLLLALHEGTESGRDVDVDTENIVHLLLELRRMSSLAEDTHFARL